MKFHTVHTCDDSSHNEVVQAKSRALESRADDHDGRSHEDSLASSEIFTEPNTDDGTDETSCVESAVHSLARGKFPRRHRRTDVVRCNRNSLDRRDMILP